VSELNYTGQFKHGMQVGGQQRKDFELRQMTTEDMLDAELEIPAGAPLNFKAELASRQLVRVGDYTGKVTVKMVRKLHPTDFSILIAALQEVAKLGEDVSPDSKPD